MNVYTVYHLFGVFLCTPRMQMQTTPCGVDAELRRYRLFGLETEFFDNLRVLFCVTLFEIFKVYTTISNHLKETPARMIVLLVFLEVSSKFINTLAQNANLDPRGTGVFVMDLGFGDNIGLFLYC